MVKSLIKRASVAKPQLVRPEHNGQNFGAIVSQGVKRNVEYVL